MRERIRQQSNLEIIRSKKEKGEVIKEPKGKVYYGEGPEKVQQGIKGSDKRNMKLKKNKRSELMILRRRRIKQEQRKKYQELKNKELR